MASPDQTPSAAAQPLTDRQRRIVRTIQEAIAERGYPPSMREIGDAAGLASLSSVTHQLGQLERFGYLRRDPGRPRALEVLLDPDGRPAGEPPVAAPVPLVPARHTGTADGDSVEVPWVGRIAAGGPILADQQVEEVMAVPRRLTGEGELFMLLSLIHI